MSQPLEVSDPAEGSVDWKGAEKYMLGANPDEAEAGPEQPDPEAPREFKYRGKVVKVDPDTYSLLEDLKKEARGANGRVGSENARLRERLARVEGMLTSREREAPAEPELRPPDPLLATKDIVAWQRQWEAYDHAREERLKSDLEKKYLSHVREVGERVQEAQKEKEWADAFYSEYSHLDDPDVKPTVAQVYTEHKEEIEALDPADARERLADLTDARLMRLRKAGKGATPNNTQRPPRIESSAGPTPRRASEDTPSRDFSAASWVARQRLKMQGRELPKEK